MNQIQTFAFQPHKVRVLGTWDQPWFVAVDVCEILGISNNRDAVASLEDDEKITVANPDSNPRAGIPHQLTAVSESGLYALIFRSRKPEARAFRKWVTSEVLPAIRKGGRYELPSPKPEAEPTEIVLAAEPELPDVEEEEFNPAERIPFLSQFRIHCEIEHVACAVQIYLGKNSEIEGLVGDVSDILFYTYPENLRYAHLPISSNAFGRRLNMAFKTGKLAAMGIGMTRRRSCHGSVIRLWKLEASGYRCPSQRQAVQSAIRTTGRRADELRRRALG